jgi:hypothetical protein
VNKALFAAMLVILAVAAQLSAAKSSADHLVPVERHEEKYRAFIQKRLCLTPFDCGRFLEMPSFQKSEFSVSLYSSGGGTHTLYRATYVEAADNLRGWSDAGRLPNRAKKVKVRRNDADIHAAAGALIKEVWTQMLSGCQAPRQREYASSNGVEGVIYGDATIGEFAVRSPNGTTLRGETELVPDLGKNTTMFIEIAEGLADYCKTPSSKRPAMLAKLDGKAKKLLARIKNNE